MFADKDKLFKVMNHKGITAMASYAIYDKECQELYAFDVIGGETTVKAVFATVKGQSGRLSIQPEGQRYALLVHTVNELCYKVDKQTLARDPALFRWQFRVEPTPNDPYLLLYGFAGNAGAPAGQLLIELLRQYTAWPVLPCWWPQLFGLGERAGLISPLAHTDNVAFAWKVQVGGWDAVLGEAGAELYLPETEEEVARYLADPWAIA